MFLIIIKYSLILLIATTQTAIGGILNGKEIRHGDEIALYNVATQSGMTYKFNQRLNPLASNHTMPFDEFETMLFNDTQSFADTIFVPHIILRNDNENQVIKNGDKVQFRIKPGFECAQSKQNAFFWANHKCWYPPADADPLGFIINTDDQGSLKHGSVFEFKHNNFATHRVYVSDGRPSEIADKGYVTSNEPPAQVNLKWKIGITGNTLHKFHANQTSTKNFFKWHASFKDEHAKVTDQLTQIRQNNSKLAADLQNVNFQFASNNATWKKQRENFTKSLSDLIQQKKKLFKKVKNIKAQSKSKSKRISMLQAQHKDFTNLIAQLQQKNAELDAELQSIKEQFISTNSTLSNRYSVSQKNISDLQLRFDNQHRHFTQLLSDSAKELNESVVHINNITQHKQSLYNELEKSKSKLKSISKDISEFHQNNSQIDAELQLIKLHLASSNATWKNDYLVLQQNMSNLQLKLEKQLNESSKIFNQFMVNVSIVNHEKQLISDELQLVNLEMESNKRNSKQKEKVQMIMTYCLASALIFAILILIFNLKKIKKLKASSKQSKLHLQQQLRLHSIRDGKLKRHNHDTNDYHCEGQQINHDDDVQNTETQQITGEQVLDREPSSSHDSLFGTEKDVNSVVTPIDEDSNIVEKMISGKIVPSFRAHTSGN